MDGPVGRGDEIAFRGESLGKAKTRCDELGKALRTEFEHVQRVVMDLVRDGIHISRMEFQDPVVQAAWDAYVDKVHGRQPAASLPPTMATEAEIALRVVEG
jgi:hypothetical protein